MNCEYWFMNLEKEGPGVDAKFTIQTLMDAGWEFVANGGDDRGEVLIFKKNVGEKENALEEDLNVGSINSGGHPLV